MADKIIYDRIWLDDYLNKIKEYENYLRLMEHYLYRARNSLSADQIELYMDIMQKLDKVEHNFRIIHKTVEKFINEAQIHALELTSFSEEQYQQLLYLK